MSSTCCCQKNLYHIPPLPGSSKFNFGINLLHGMYACCPTYDVASQKEFQYDESTDTRGDTGSFIATDAKSIVVIDGVEYATPNHLAVMTNYKMTVSDTSTLYENESSWEKEWQASVGASIKVNSAFYSASASANASMYSFNALFTKSAKKTIVTTVTCSLYNATFTGVNSAPLSPVFLSHLQAAKQDKSNWFKLFDENGTHVVHTGTFGGMLLAITRFDSDYVQKQSKKQLEAQVNVAVKGAFASGSVNASSVAANSSELSANSDQMEYTASAIGGVVSTDMSTYKNSVSLEPELLLDPLAKMPFGVVALTDVIMKHSAITSNSSYALTEQQKNDMMEAYRNYFSQPGKSGLFAGLPTVFSGQSVSVLDGTYSNPMMSMNKSFGGLDGMLVGYVQHMASTDTHVATTPFLGLASATSTALQPATNCCSFNFQKITVAGESTPRYDCFKATTLTVPLLQEQAYRMGSRTKPVKTNAGTFGVIAKVNVLKFDYNVNIEALPLESKALNYLWGDASSNGYTANFTGFLLVRFTKDTADSSACEIRREVGTKPIIAAINDMCNIVESGYNAVTKKWQVLIPVIKGDTLMFYKYFDKNCMVTLQPFKLSLKNEATLTAKRSVVSPFMLYQADTDCVLQIQYGSRVYNTTNYSPQNQVAVFASSQLDTLNSDTTAYSPLSGKRDFTTLRAYGSEMFITLTVPIVAGEYYKIILSNYDANKQALDTQPVDYDENTCSFVAKANPLDYFVAEVTEFTS